MKDSVAAALQSAHHYVNPYLNDSHLDSNGNPLDGLMTYRCGIFQMKWSMGCTFMKKRKYSTTKCLTRIEKIIACRATRNQKHGRPTAHYGSPLITSSLATIFINIFKYQINHINILWVLRAVKSTNKCVLKLVL